MLKFSLQGCTFSDNAVDKLNNLHLASIIHLLKIPEISCLFEIWLKLLHQRSCTFSWLKKL